ncbi:MAG: hypothetical protein WDZ80_00920 [Candidatus Paceibacterota bacterium]
MKIITTKRFDRSFKKLPKNIQKILGKQLKLLLSNFSHPSLKIKKVKSLDGILEGRVNKSYRFLFSIMSEAYVLLDVGDHDKILK